MSSDKDDEQFALWNCFARKSGRLSEVSETKSEKKKEVRYTTAMPTLFPSQSFGYDVAVFDEW